MYKVIKDFTDLQNGHKYQVGDSFPVEGAEVSEARISQLLSGKNRQKTPLIAKEGAPSVEIKDESLNLATPARSEKVEQVTPVKRGRKKKSN